MPREDAAAKGRRYLAEGRLVIQRHDGLRITARCRGDSAEWYDVGFRGGWFCSCPAKTRCAHLVALMLCTIRPLVSAR